MNNHRDISWLDVFLAAIYPLSVVGGMFAFLVLMKGWIAATFIMVFPLLGLWALVWALIAIFHGWP